MFAIERIEADLQGVVAGLDPACIEGPDAARLTKSAARIERLAATAKMLLAQRAAQTNAWRRKSHAATSEQWLAETSGCSEGAARELFATANRLTELPATEDEMRSGDLSPQQAAQVTAGASKDPSAEQRLLRKAKRSGMRDLRDEKERVIAGVTDEDEARRTAKTDRHFRTWTKGFATHGQFSGPTDDVAKLLHGVDVQTVVSNTRHVPAALKIAIAERDLRCKVRGCDRTIGLHRHHTKPFSETHHTRYSELGNACDQHHHLIHDLDYEILDHADGTWSLRAPPREAAA
jgi:hypothetical protein